MKKADFSTKGGRALADLAREAGRKPVPSDAPLNTTEIQGSDMLKLNDPID